MRSRWHQRAPTITAVLAVWGALWALARHPQLSPDALDQLAARFRFTALRLPPPATPAGGVRYGVNPSARQLLNYLHPYGGGVALGDLDGDGLPNDVCHTDIRAKALVLAPVPGTGARYAPFELALDLPPGRETRWPTLCRFADLNEDGRTDVLVTLLGGTPQLFLRRGAEAEPTPPSAEAFARRPLVEGPERDWYPTAATFTDVDGDGHLDLVLGLYYPDDSALYDTHATHGFEMNEGFAHARNGGTNRIFLWDQASAGADPDVRFRALDDPFPGDGERGWTLAIGAGDIDRDGLSDLYIANDYGPDTMLLNRSRPGDVQLHELLGEASAFLPQSMVMGRDSFKGMGVDFADLNGDGLLDLYVSNIASPFALGESHYVWMSTGDRAAVDRGVAPYEERAAALGVAWSAWAWDTRMDDFDNDGALELVQATGGFKGGRNGWALLGQLGIINDNLMKDPGTWPALPVGIDLDGWVPNPFYAADADGHYWDLSSRLFPGVLPNSRGLATADVDGDGDLDMAWGNHWEDSTFYRNDAPEAGAWLGLHLLLPPSDAPAPWQVHDGPPRWREGSPAVGAWVSVRTPDGRRQVRQVDGGNGHSGARSPDLHVGLGAQAADAALQVEITWRDRQGALHHDSLPLRPGQHTVVLGAHTAEAAP